MAHENPTTEYAAAAKLIDISRCLASQAGSCQPQCSETSSCVTRQCGPSLNHMGPQACDPGLEEGQAVGVVRVGADEEGAGDSMPGRALDTTSVRLG